MAVEVAARIRPYLQDDEDVDTFPCINYDDNHKNSVTVAGVKQFTLDKCFKDDDPQSDIYIQFISPLVSKLLNGQNCSVLAYGQTGSGKTYTMGSDYTGTSAISEDNGIIPRILSQIFEDSRKEYDSINFKVSFLEILNDLVYDILVHPKKVVLIQDTGKIQYSNLSEVEVETLEESLFQLSKGVKHRAQARTQLNQNSSRSHAFFILKMTRKTENSVIESTLHLVDLAGSESSKRANTKGERFVEGVSINRSLLFLGEVIKALSTKSGVNYVHVPYRNHVLTKILKETLNGTSLMRMIACVNPTAKSIPETINTLRFACNTRNLPHCTLSKGAQESKFQAHLREVLPTPVKGGLYQIPATPLNNSKTTDFMLPSTSKGLGRPLLSSTLQRPPPPPKFNISPEKQPACEFDNFLSPLANKISTLLEQRISETVIEHTRSSARFSKRLSTFPEDYDECYDSFLPRRSSAADSEALSKLVSPIAEKLRKVMDQRFMELEQKLKDCAKVVNKLPPTNRKALNDVTNLTSDKSDQMESSLFPKITENATVTECHIVENFATPVKKQRKSICAAPRCSPIKTRRRTMMEMTSGVTEFHVVENLATPMKKQRKSICAAPRSSPIKTRRRTMMEISGFMDPAMNREPNKTRTHSMMEVSVVCTAIKTRRQSKLLEIDTENIPVSPVAINRSKAKQTKRQTAIFHPTAHAEDASTSGMEDFCISPMKSRRSVLKSRNICTSCTSPATPAINHLLDVGKKTNAKSKTRRQTSRVQPTQGQNTVEHHRQYILSVLNTGSMTQLQKLPAIGPKSAYMIFTYRNLYGELQSFEELKKVGLPHNFCNRFAKSNLL